MNNLYAKFLLLALLIITMLCVFVLFEIQRNFRVIEEKNEYNPPLLAPIKPAYDESTMNPDAKM